MIRNNYFSFIYRTVYRVLFLACVFHAPSNIYAVPSHESTLSASASTKTDTKQPDIQPLDISDQADAIKAQITAQPAEIAPVSIYKLLSYMYLPTKAAEERKEIEQLTAIEKQNKAVAKGASSIGESVKIPALGEIEKLRHAYFIFHSLDEKRRQAQLIYNQENQNANNTINTPINTPIKPIVNSPQYLDPETLIDLEVFSGQKNLQRNVADLFEPHLHTALGKVQLQKMLLQPLTNIDELQKRQEIIKLLLADSAHLAYLNQKLTELKKTENEFLWFWKNIGEKTFNKLEQTAVPTPVPLLHQIDSTFNNGTIIKYLEKKPMITELMSRSALFWNPIWSMVGLGLGWFGLYKQTQVGQNQTTPIKTGNDAIKQTFIQKLLTLQAKTSKLQSILTLAVMAVMLPYSAVKGTAAYNAATNAIHAKMNTVSQFIKISRELVGTDGIDKQSQDVKKLLDLLNTSTFQSTPSFFSYKGRAITAFTLMNELKENFETMLEKLGQLDAYVAIANFVQAKQKTTNACCFPTYIKNATPYVKLNNYWHPFIEKPVPNNIELGGSSAKNIIVTGPNAGGKSTALKSITLAIVLAQTLGISTAQSMTLTPYNQICTYMNITDNAGTESLFQAEMHRAARLINLVKNQKPNEFIFVVMDELFTGTNPLEGKAAAYGVIKKLVTYNNSTLIFATHYKELTALEKETPGKIKNFKVNVNKDVTGKISYPYKLVPGISDQTIALDLLTQDGFDPEILKNAYAMLNRLKSGRIAG
ncbi:MAG: hypothetical protein ABH827_00125 [bacterium]